MASKRKSTSVVPPVAEASDVAVKSDSTLLDVDALREIVEIVEASEVTRLSWRRGNERLLIVRGHPPAPSHFPSSSMQAPSTAVTAVAAHPETTTPRTGAGNSSGPSTPPVSAEKPGIVVTSPFVGTFYRTPAPDQPSFVEVGASVRKGQVLCIIEAMKLMNEIEAETAGRVAEVLVQNGQPVEFGQPLFRLEPA